MIRGEQGTLKFSIALTVFLGRARCRERTRHRFAGHHLRWHVQLRRCRADGRVAARGETDRPGRESSLPVRILASRTAGGRVARRHPGGGLHLCRGRCHKRAVQWRSRGGVRPGCVVGRHPVRHRACDDTVPAPACEGASVAHARSRCAELGGEHQPEPRASDRLRHRHGIRGHRISGLDSVSRCNRAAQHGAHHVAHADDRSVALHERRTAGGAG